MVDISQVHINQKTQPKGLQKLELLASNIQLKTHVKIIQSFYWKLRASFFTFVLAKRIQILTLPRDQL